MSSEYEEIFRNGNRIEGKERQPTMAEKQRVSRRGTEFTRTICTRFGGDSLQELFDADLQFHRVEGFDDIVFSSVLQQLNTLRSTVFAR